MKGDHKPVESKGRGQKTGSCEQSLHFMGQMEGAAKRIEEESL